MTAGSASSRQRVGHPARRWGMGGLVGRDPDGSGPAGCAPRPGHLLEVLTQRYTDVPAGSAAPAG